MKKIFALLLAAVMLLPLVSCAGGTQSVSDQPARESQSQIEESQPSEEETTPQPEETDQPSGGGEVPEMFPEQATIEETVLVDEKDVKITATELTYTSGSAELSLLLENNSDQELSFASHNNCPRSINGYMVDGGFMSESVAAGKKANTTLTFRANELIALGITEIADIELSFELKDEDYETYLETGPRQIQTSAAASYDDSEDTYQSAINSGWLAAAYGFTVDYFANDELYNDNGLRVISETLLTNKDGDRALFLEVENNASEPLLASMGDIYINGLMIHASWSSDSISAGSRRIFSLNISSMMDDAYWSTFGLTDYGDITLSIQALDPDYKEVGAAGELSFSIPGVNVSYDGSGETVYDEGGIQVIYKGLVEDESSYSEDLHALFLVKNGYTEPVTVTVGRSSLSVNGYMTDCYTFDRPVAPGRGRIMDVQIEGDSLEENGLTEVADISEMEMTMTIKDNQRDVIAEPVVTISAEG